MAKRKGSSASGPRGRKKAAKEGRDAKTLEGGGVEDECDQLRREFYSLEEKRAKLLEKEHKLEEPLPPVRREVEQLQQSLLPKSSVLKELCSAREVENAQRLDKLPKEVWDKILDPLDENDLFPLALSCRYFRQKQKELVARARQNVAESGEPRLALKMNLKQKLREGQPATAAYLRFCSKEKVPGTHRLLSFCLEWSCASSRDSYVSCLAAYHGHLPLLQELQAASEAVNSQIVQSAGESSFPRFLLLLLCFGF